MLPRVGSALQQAFLLSYRNRARRFGVQLRHALSIRSLVDTSLAPSRVNVSSRQSSPPGEKGVG